MEGLKCIKDLEKVILRADNIYYKFISGKIDEERAKKSLRKKLEKEGLEVSEEKVNDEYGKVKKIYKEGRAYAKRFAGYGNSRDEVLDNIKVHTELCGVCSKKVAGLKRKYMTINLAELTEQEIENAKYFGLLN